MKCARADLIAAVREWYSLEDMGTGGPLHIVTDDYNVEDIWIESCRDHLLNDPWYDYVRDVDWCHLGLKILDGLKALSIKDRKAVLKEAHSNVNLTKTS